MTSKSKVYFFFEGVSLSLSHRGQLKKFIERIFRAEGKKLGSLNYIFCSDARLRQINKEYLRHDYYTDIITFDLTEPGSSTTAEIYISVERVRDNALILEIPFKNEIHRVLFHGVLHLCGYGDKTKVQVKKIRAKEDQYLASYLV